MNIKENRSAIIVEIIVGTNCAVWTIPFDLTISNNARKYEWKVRVFDVSKNRGMRPMS